MEASALQAPVGLTRQRSLIGMSVLRLRSDEQLVALVRSGHDEAFQVIHDRYRSRLFAYVRQMLRSRQDAEDALQDVFERAYWSLTSGGRDRELALRPWLYRIAHNRCIDHLRRPAPPPPEAMLQLGPPVCDPTLEVDRRETVRRLMVDVSRLPAQQRSALLMRELGGISYADVAQALGVTVPAVKSLLVRARVSLVQAGQARDAACVDIRAELVLAHEGRVRPTAMARRHLRDCPGCREFRGDLRGVRRQLLALSPSVGPIGLLAKLLGGGGGTGGGAAAAWSGSAASGAAGGGGVFAAAGTLASGVTHVATIVAAGVVTAGGAAALQHTMSTQPAHHRPAHAVASAHRTPAPALKGAATTSAVAAAPALIPATVVPAHQPSSSPVPVAATASAPAPPAHRLHRHAGNASNQMLAPAPDQASPPAPPAGQASSGLVDPAPTSSTPLSGAGSTSSSTTGMTSSGPGSGPASSTSSSPSTAQTGSSGPTDPAGTTPTDVTGGITQPVSTTTAPSTGTSSS